MKLKLKNPKLSSMACLQAGAVRKEKVMSHIYTYGKKVTDLTLFAHVCSLKGYSIELGENLLVRQFGRNTVKAVAAIKIPGWKYDIAITKDGELKYDNWGAESNSMDKLSQTFQDYYELGTLNEVPWEKVHNHTIETLQNGDRKLVLEFE